MGNQRRQGIRKIRVLSLSEVIACHDDPGSKITIVTVEGSQGSTGGGLHKLRDMGIPIREDRVFDGNPIQGVKIREA